MIGTCRTRGRAEKCVENAMCILEYTNQNKALGCELDALGSDRVQWRDLVNVIINSQLL